jgi:Asp/Glu/hydantoin racemase
VARILVVNPNSNPDVTREIDRSIAPLRFATGPVFEAVGMADGPSGIETQQDVNRAAVAVAALIASRARDFDAFVVACFSDPGVYAAREAVRKPVLGIARCALAQALAMGERLGIVSILPASVARHRRQIADMGAEGRLAADLPLGMTVAELSHDRRLEERLTSVGRSLAEKHGADVLVLGCAGMGRMQGFLEARLGVPVIDPVHAAAAMALARTARQGAVLPADRADMPSAPR